MSASTSTALLMAGGRSVRMRAGGSPQHKGLRTALGLPLIEHNLLALLWFGFQGLYVAISSHEKELAAWVQERGRKLVEASGAHISILFEDQGLGTIGAAASLPREVRDVVVVNVDNLTSLDLRRFAQFHQKSGVSATIATHDQTFRLPFGRVDIERQRITRYLEKPELLISISSGIYALSRSAMDMIPIGSHLDLPRLIERLLGANHEVASYQHHEPWIDINDEQALSLAEALISSRGDWPGSRRSVASNA